MNVTINGYVSYTCSNCKAAYNLEATQLIFEENVSAEADEDEHLRYNAQLITHCSPCASKMLIKLDVWEHPESIVNYSYYSTEGVSDVECEFSIEHFFDDTTATEDDYDFAPDEQTANHGDGDFDGDMQIQFNESTIDERYEDLYDDED